SMEARTTVAVAGAAPPAASSPSHHQQAATDTDSSPPASSVRRENRDRIRDIGRRIRMTEGFSGMAVMLVTRLSGLKTAKGNVRVKSGFTQQRPWSGRANAERQHEGWRTAEQAFPARP